MGAILKGIQSVLIALGIIAIVGTGVILYYNTIKPDGSEETAIAETTTSGNEISVDMLTADASTGTETAAAVTGTDDTAAGVFSIENGHKHTYTKTVLKPATCSEAGEAKYTCYCGDFYNEAIPALDHTSGDWITVRAATSTQTGLKQKTCTVCGRVLQEEVIPMLAADKTDTKTTSSKNSTTDHKHTYTYEITTQPTCTENGEKTYTCSICGSTFKTKIAAMNHPSRKTVITKGDCGNPGKVECICSICDAVISSETLTYDHKWGAWEVTTAATTTATGVKTRTCSVCSEQETKTIPKLTSSGGGTGDDTCSHTYTSSLTSQPTCTTAGVTTYTCSKCGKTYTESTPAALGHLPGNWVVVTEATTTTEGKRVKYCRRCNAIVVEETIAKIDAPHVHTYVSTVIKEPTCTSTGTRKYTCSGCGDWYTSSIKATGHTPVTESGHTVCSTCGAILD